MKSFALLLICAALVLGISPACSKKSPGPCTDTGLSFTSSPTVNAVEPPGPGPDFPLIVTINAPIPAGGVTILVTAKPQTPANAAAFFTQTITTSNAINNFTIRNTQPGVAANVEITVSSVTCSTNRATGTYTYSRK